MLPIMLASNRILSADSARKFAIAIVIALPVSSLRVVLVAASAKIWLLVVRSNPLRPARRSPLIAYVGHLAIYLSPLVSICEVVRALNCLAKAVLLAALV